MSFGAARAQAFPTLQLDIVGGYYDPVTETIVSSGPDFTLVALLTPKNNDSAADVAALLNTTYYISAAVNPPAGPAASNLGSFTFDTVNYNVTGDLTYGTPPIELYTAAGADVPPAGDLQTHSIFPTYFAEFAFNFTADQRTLQYDSAENPGGLSPTTLTDQRQVSYYQTFNITTSLTGGGTAIHFDLYNTFIANCAIAGNCVWDEDIGLNAPFSHDAQSASSVPEPQTLMVLSTGLLLAGRLLARRRQQA
jgi:hypothetical protein